MFLKSHGAANTKLIFVISENISHFLAVRMKFYFLVVRLSIKKGRKMDLQNDLAAATASHTIQGT